MKDYRPIATLAVLTKPLERHIHKHLTGSLETHHLFHSFQSGFRCGQCGQTAVTRLTDILLSVFNRRQMSGAVFLDFSRAFDLVHHDILLKKLSSYILSMASITVFTILPTGSSTLRTCKWHIHPRNIYNKRSASSVDPRPPFVLHLY